MKSINVIKASGEQEPFEELKLRRSLKSAGASDALIDTITDSVSKLLVDGISTRKIYKEAFKQLRAESQRVAGRYKLKEAIFDLGPSGYPFEKFVGELLSRQGYETQIGVIVQGDCVNHEVDVIAHKDEEYLLVECKFHNRKENRCNVKVPLYIQSRFLDVKNNWTSLPGHKNKTHKGWVVTNTRFSGDAEMYGSCVGLKLLSWDYPKNNGIKDLIGRMNLHPITCLSGLNKQEKRQLLDKDLIFCRQISEDKSLLDRAGIHQSKIHAIYKEAAELCNHQR